MAGRIPGTSNSAVKVEAESTPYSIAMRPRDICTVTTQRGRGNERDKIETPVLLIDLSSIAHPIWHMSQQEPDPDHTSQSTAAIVRRLASDHPHTAVCCDSPISFRKELDATYKANRPPAEAPLHHQIDLAREALEADGFPVWRVDGFEGDDLIATATRQADAGASYGLDRQRRQRPARARQ